MDKSLVWQFQRCSRSALARGDRASARIYARQVEEVLRYEWEKKKQHADGKRFIWYDSDTKQTRTQISKPGSRGKAEPQPEKAPKTPARKPAKAKADPAAISDRLKALKATEITPEVVSELTDSLTSMTIAQLHQARESMGLDVKGLKSAPKSKLVAALIAHKQGGEKAPPVKKEPTKKPPAKKEPVKKTPEPTRESPAKTATTADITRVWDSLPGAKHNQVHLADVQSALGLSVQQTHDLVKDLEKKGILFTEGAEGRGGLSPRDKAIGYKDQAGQFITSIGMRDKSKSESPAQFPPDNAPRMKNRNPEQAKPLAAFTESLNPTKQERDSLVAYSDEFSDERLGERHNSYKIINAFLRGQSVEESATMEGVSQDEFEKRMKKSIDTIQGFLGRSILPSPVTVYRGLPLNNTDEFMAKIQNCLKTGTPLELKGFQSTSLDPSVARRFTSNSKNHVVMEIVARNGAYIDNLMQFSEGEHEVLLPHGMKYRVHAVKKVTMEGQQKEIIQLEQIWDQKPPGIS